MRISINARPPGTHLPRKSRVTCTVCWGSLKIVKIRVISSTPCWNTLLMKKIRIANLYFMYWPPGCVTPAAPQTPNGIHYLPNHIRHTRELFGQNDTFVPATVCCMLFAANQCGSIPSIQKDPPRPAQLCITLYWPHYLTQTYTTCCIQNRVYKSHKSNVWAMKTLTKHKTHLNQHKRMAETILNAHTHTHAPPSKTNTPVNIKLL